jgi:hypothetical protein
VGGIERPAQQADTHPAAVAEAGNRIGGLRHGVGLCPEPKT